MRRKRQLFTTFYLLVVRTGGKNKYSYQKGLVGERSRYRSEKKENPRADPEEELIWQG